MAIEDFAGLLETAPEILRQLPMIIQTLQIIGYFFVLLFFGSIIVKGYTGYIHPAARFLFRVGLGFVALLSGIGISEILPFFNTGIYKLFQVDVFVGGIIATAVLTLVVYMISHNVFNVEGIKKQIEKLQNKIKKSEELKGKGTKLTDPVRIGGIIIACIFVTFAMINFRGFPDVFSDLGLSQERFNELASQIESVRDQFGGQNLSEGCVSIATLAQVYGTNLLNTRYNNSAVESLIEQGANANVLELYSVEYNQQTMILGITDNEKLCSSTLNQFCECISLPKR